MKHSIHQKSGYILLETMVAMIILGLGSVMVHSVMRQGIQARGQAQDITQARFLLEDLMAQIALQPALLPGERQGMFEGNEERFSYRYEINRINVPGPRVTPGDNLSPERILSLKRSMNRLFVVQIKATAYWSRAGTPFEETMETLLGANHWHHEKGNS